MKPATHPTLLVDSIGCLLTLDPDLGDGPLGIVEDAAVAVAGERILFAGARRRLPAPYREAETIGAGGALVTPGLIDCHTHLVFAGDRSDEFFARLAGRSYEEIARSGGGIRRTVEATAGASDEKLRALARSRLDRFLAAGVTTVEAKSGYALSPEGELRLLRIAGSLGHAVSVVPTFLGAHVVPPGFAADRGAYVRVVTEEMLPRVVAERLSGICDVFCDEAAFSVDEAALILGRAKGLGLEVKLHADQLTGNGGAELAARLGALSADHLERVSDEGVAALSRSGTVAVLLPGAVFFLGKRSYPPARKLLDAGVPVAVSTDFNPGTSPTENLPLMMTLAAVELRMTAEEIWTGVTTSAARALALKDRGRLAPGLRADLVVWEAARPEEVPGRFGGVAVRCAVSGGRPFGMGLDSRGASH
jgi:imidazolonepropionase